MSNFTRIGWHPVEKVARAANWIDDHFGRHCYGVKFDGDEHVYRPDEVEIPLDLVLVPLVVLLKDVTNPSPVCS